MHIETSIEVKEVQKTGDKIIVKSQKKDGKETEIEVESLFIAAGRKSNADLLQVEKTGVDVDERGYIIVDEFYNTSKKNIIAFGDDFNFDYPVRGQHDTAQLVG